VAIERTTETETRGKYLLIFQEADMEKAKASIGELIEAFGRTSDRDSTKIALERFQEYPEFESIQRVSQSVQSKGLRIREMLEAAAAQRTASTPKKTKQPKFQFHVNKELQKQLKISNIKSYSSATKQTPIQEKQLTIVQTTKRLQPIRRKQQERLSTQTTAQTTQTMEETNNQQQELNEHGMGITREEWEEIDKSQSRTRTSIFQNATTQESRTVATNNSGLSIDQQTITTMMTQITHQFKEMERDRITREEILERERQEREAKAEEKREEREARVEEKRAEAQREMYKFMQTMMIMNNNNNQEKQTTNIPEELTTESTEQTSAITTSVVTAASMNTTNGKRSSALLSNTDEETDMIDKETETETTEAQEDMDEDTVNKRNKKHNGNEEEKEVETTDEDEEMMIDNEQQANLVNTIEKVADEEMTEQEKNSSSFTASFNNHQFQQATNKAPWSGAKQQ